MGVPLAAVPVVGAAIPAAPAPVGLAVPVGQKNLFLDDNQLYKFSEPGFSELIDLLKQQEFNSTHAPGEFDGIFNELAKVVDVNGSKLYKEVFLYKNVVDPLLVDIFLIEDKNARTGNPKTLNKQNSYNLCTILEVEKDNPVSASMSVIAGGKVAPVHVRIEEIPKISLFNFYKKVKKLAKEEFDNYDGIYPMPQPEFDKLIGIIKSRKFLAVFFKENAANPKLLEVVLKEKLDGSAPFITILLSKEASDKLRVLLEEEQEKQEMKKDKNRSTVRVPHKNSLGLSDSTSGRTANSKRGEIATGSGDFENRRADDKGLAKKPRQGYVGGGNRGSKGYDGGGYSGGRGNYGNYGSGGNYGSTPKSGYAGSAGSNYGNRGTAYTGSGPAPVSSSVGVKSLSPLSINRGEVIRIDSGSYKRKKRNNQEIHKLEDYFFGIQNESSGVIKKEKQPNRYAQAVQRSIELDERKKRIQHDLLSNNEQLLDSTNEQKGSIVAAIGGVISTCIIGIKVFFNWLYESAAAYF